MCSWSNTQNVNMDKLDWELTSREAEKHYLTPQADHTLGTERGHFLFLSSSNRTAANENAQLLSPHLPPTKGTCLKFWAIKQQSPDSQLTVWRKSGGQLHEMLAVHETRETWRRFDINITSDEEYQIVLEGIKGTSGFWALDDIVYTVGVDCTQRVTDSITSKKPDNAGGIAASVIVVLLLIGTLVALLVYYLKTRQTTPSSSSSPATTGFSNEAYDEDLTQDRISVPTIPNHPMEAGSNYVSDLVDFKEMEVA